MSGADARSRDPDPRWRVLALQDRVQHNRARYAEPVACWPLSTAPVLWITGLAGSGKTTLAGRLLRRLASIGQYPLLLDGDTVREALDDVDTRHDHSPDRRRQRAWRLLRLAHCAASDGRPVIVATVSLIEDIQQANRLCHRHFGEVLMHAPMTLLARRRPDFYVGKQAQVVGCDQPAHFPPAPELMLQPPTSLDEQQRQMDQVLALWCSLGRTTP